MCFIFIWDNWIYFLENYNVINAAVKDIYLGAIDM